MSYTAIGIAWCVLAMSKAPILQAESECSVHTAQARNTVPVHVAILAS